jgi:hypothetical protein|tara:strand:+ start:3074 stop:3175 length:102 start_codon:yes stop_codon:yes gene_type:complete
VNDEYKKEKIEKTNVEEDRMEWDSFEKSWFPNV